MQICLATNNAHKIAEVQAILGNSIQLSGLKDIGCLDELPETQNTISGNSHQKAAYVFNNYHVACLADDSGLEVDALHGEPGVDSAHYAGPQRSFDDNMNLLLKNLDGISNRKANFKTILTLAMPDGTFHQFEGILNGVILKEKRGVGGFGYDPLFLPDGHSATLAEMTMAEKNKISHRAKALHLLTEFLDKTF